MKLPYCSMPSEKYPKISFPSLLFPDEGADFCTRGETLLDNAQAELANKHDRKTMNNFFMMSHLDGFVNANIEI